MRRKKKQLLFLLVGLFFVGFGLAQAQNNGVGNKINKLTNMSEEEKAAKKEEIEAKAENRWETVTCKKIETRMRARYEKYNANKNLHKQTYENMKNKVNKIIADYKAKGFDVSVLEADMLKLEEKLQKLTADHEALIQKMKEMETGVCTSTKESLGNKIHELQKYRLETIKVDIQDIRKFYSTVLRPDLVALIQQVKASASPVPTPTAVIE